MSGEFTYATRGWSGQRVESFLETSSSPQHLNIGVSEFLLWCYEIYPGLDVTLYCINIISFCNVAVRSLLYVYLKTSPSKTHNIMQRRISNIYYSHAGMKRYTDSWFAGHTMLSAWVFFCKIIRPHYTFYEQQTIPRNFSPVSIMEPHDPFMLLSWKNLNSCLNLQLDTVAKIKCKND